MPAKGKHRRPKSPRFSRSIAVAGTGGAALALPLMGATGAHAATQATAVAHHVEKAPATAPAKKAAPATTTKTYAVRSGDYLSKIADEQNVSGGWKKIYSDNRSAIGEDPSLIHPGLKLSLGGKAAPAAHSATHASAKATTSAKPDRATTEAKPAQATPATDTAASDSASANGSSGYTLPVAASSVGTGYKVAGSMWSSGYHTGVDFVIPTGTTLKSIAAGTVVSAGWGGAYGNQVVIQHADGKYSQYAHMSSLSVSAGQTVTEGQQIGLSGATGNVTGPHLHFEIRTTPDYGSDVDPVAYLRSHGVAVG
ncbi:peptidase [Streptomyces populi]|uniref:Peptidase n=1 Tax=Streptomyces populi TaxID=2058924 RepID=A0A2I0ST43_9ACTN|nr:LysM peptidoglycan-binding domain-containing M23 family metallopeptidase [Streptomyces populi]PKT73090.1 peptidase [Streptomyces populi]